MNLIKSNKYFYLVICMVAPILSSLLRKIIPGQPAFIEAFSILAIFFCYAFVDKKKNLPSWIFSPIIAWGAFQILYAIPAILENWEIGAVSLITRVGPMFLAAIAYYSIDSIDDLIKTSTIFAIISIILLPFGVFASIRGNETLPLLLRPIIKISELGRDYRTTLISPSTVFTSQWIMSWSMLATLYMTLSCLAVRQIGEDKKKLIIFIAGAISSLVLSYLSIRRGSFYSGIIGVAFLLFIIKNKNVKLNIILIIVISTTLIFLTNTSGVIKRYSGSSRMQFVFSMEETDPRDRVEHIAIPFITYWLKTNPFGSFLGFAGPEGRSYGTYNIIGFNIIEVGGAQLAAEMGVVGAFMFPAIIFLLLFRIYQKSRKLSFSPTINILLLFELVIFLNYYLKELLALVNPSIAVFFFWSTPGLCAALITNSSIAYDKQQ